MHFEENQLFRVSLGFSPLIQDHGREWQLTTPIRPPPCFRKASPCLGLDRRASGPVPVISGAFTPCSSLLSQLRAFAFVPGTWLKPLTLTTEANSLPRFSKRTLRHCNPTIVLSSYENFLLVGTFHASADFIRLVSGSFHPAFAVLFSFLSPY